jgi:transposase
MPNDLPLWSAVSHESQRWLAVDCFESLAQYLRAVLRIAAGRDVDPTTAIIDSRIIRSMTERGSSAGYDGAKRKNGSILHLAIDALRHLLALDVAPAGVDDRAVVARLAEEVQEATDDSVKLVYADQGYTGEKASSAARDQGIYLQVVKLPEAIRGFVLLPKRWVVERSFAWSTRCRRLIKDYDR